MCFVLQNHLGKGARCAPPLHPPGLWLLQGIEPIAEPAERIAVSSLAGLPVIMTEYISLFASIIALCISASTLWLTFLRRGRLRMTNPLVVSFAYDTAPKITPKIFLRTLLYSTSVQGLVVEAMYAKIISDDQEEVFSFWGYKGTNEMVPGSGIYVAKTGVEANHHFALSIHKPTCEFKAGVNVIQVFCKLVERRKPTRLTEIKITLTNEQASALAQEIGVIFEFDPETQNYVGHLRKC